MAGLRNSKHGFSVVVSVCISLFFSYAAYRSVEVFTDFEVEKTRLKIAHEQINQARKQRQRVDHYNRAMVTLGQFENQVQRFGLAAENWQTYDVNVDRSLSFYEAENILDQLAHSKTYYFQPETLYLGTGAYRNKPVAPPETGSSSSGTLFPGEDTSEAIQETGSVEPQGHSATELQPVAGLEGDRQGGDLTLMVQGKFIVRDGS